MNGNRIVYITWFIIMSLMLYIEFKPEEKKQIDTYIAVFQSGQGKVYCREPYQTTWDSMQIGDKLSPGSHVATGPKSGAIIVLKDGHEIKLEENSQINLGVANDVSQDNYLVDVIQGNMQVAKAEIKPQKSQNVIKTVLKNITEKPADFKSVKSFFTNIVKPEEKGINVTTKDVAVNIPENIKALNINATGAKTKFTTEDGKVFVPHVAEQTPQNLTAQKFTDSKQKTKPGADQLTLNERVKSGANTEASALATTEDNELELALESKFPDEFSPDQASSEKPEGSDEGSDEGSAEIAPESTPENPVPVVEEEPAAIKMADIPKFQKHEKLGYDGVVIWEENFLAIEPLLNISIKASKSIPKEHNYVLKIWPGNNEAGFEKIKTQVKTKNELKFVVPKAKFINWLTASPTPLELNWGLYLTNENSNVSNRELFRDSFQFFSVPHLKGSYFEVKIDSSKKPPSSEYTYFRNNITTPTSSYNIADKSLLRKIAEGRTKDHIVEIKIKDPPVKTDKNVAQTLFVSKGKVIFSSDDVLTREKITAMLRELGADFAFKGKPSDILNSQQILQNSIGASKKVQANFLTLTSHYPIHFNYKALLKLIYGPKALSQSDSVFLREKPEIFTAEPTPSPDAKLRSLLTVGADGGDSGEKMVAFLNIDKNSGLAWKKKADIKLASLRGFRDANPQMINANFVVNGISLSSFFKKEKDNKKIFDFIEKIAKCDLLIVSKELSEKDVQISLFYKESTNQTFHLQMDLLEKSQIPRWVYESLGYDATAGAKVVDSYIYLSNYPKKLLKSNQGFIWPNSEQSVFFNADMQLSTPFLFQCETADEKGCIAKILTNNKSKLPDFSDSKVTLLGRRTIQDSQKSTTEISH